jgi:hypothetical protein
MCDLIVFPNLDTNFASQMNDIAKYIVLLFEKIRHAGGACRLSLHCTTLKNEEFSTNIKTVWTQNKKHVVLTENFLPTNFRIFPKITKFNGEWLQNFVP